MAESKSDELIEAEARLADAIDKLCAARIADRHANDPDFDGVPRFLADWLLVYELAPMDLDAPTTYGTAVSGGNLAEHRALGLLDIAGQLVDEG